MIAEYIIDEESNPSTGTNVFLERPVTKYQYLQRVQPARAVSDEDNIQKVFQARLLFEKQIKRETEKRQMLALSNQFVSNLSELTDMAPQPLPHPIYQKPYRIMESTHDFIRKQKKSFALNESLDKVSNRILEFMRERDVRSEIIIDLEVDTEYGDWIEPRIKILVEPSKFEKAYEFFNDLLDFSLKGIRKKETTRFMITIDTK